MKVKHYFYILIVLLAGFLLHAPTVQYPGFLQTSNHDGYIAAGDHGRDLYAFQRTMNGERPYQDYWWVYGPVMPYYYAFMMKIFGANIHAVLLGKLFLQVLAGVLFFLLSARLMSGFAALTASLWFLFFNQNFYHTYNNAGAIVLILAVLLCLFDYLQLKKTVYFYAAQPLLILLMLIKFNIGAGVMIVFYLCAIGGRRYLKDAVPEDLRRYGSGLLAVSLATTLLYAWSLQGLPQNLLREYIPLANKDLTQMQPVGKNILIFVNIYWNYFTSGKLPALLALLVFIMALQTVLGLRRKDRGEDKRKQDVVILTVLVLFYGVLLSEILLTGIFYRVFWSVPVTILFMFVFLDRGTDRLGKILKGLLFSTLLLLLFLQLVDRFDHFGHVRSDPHRFWAHPKARIYIDNEPAWLDVVDQTTMFLDKHLAPGERFLAIPYEPLYYFLTERTAPVRRLIFYKNAQPDMAEERQIIDALERQRVNWIVLSNTAHHVEAAFGTFGETHCVELARYIEANYEIVATFGDFTKPGDWSGDYAVHILKRRSPK